MSAGIEAAGYKALRIDNHEYNGGVMDEILAQIRRGRRNGAIVRVDEPLA